MQALVWTNRRIFELRERPDPVVTRGDEVKIQLRIAGICGTDLSLFRHQQSCPAEIIRGHEGAGVITEIGDQVTSVRPDDLVVIDPNQYCGECPSCSRGRTHLCTGTQGSLDIAGITRDGLFAESFVCSERFVHKLPKETPFELAVMIEPLACVLNNMIGVGVRPGNVVVIIGSGPMGFLSQLVAGKLASKVIASDATAARRQFVAPYVTAVQAPSNLNADWVRQVNDGLLADVVIDAVGNQVEQALTLVERGGNIVILGLDHGYAAPILPARLATDAIKIVGFGEYNQLFPDTISFARQLPELPKTVTHSFELDKHQDAFDFLLNPRCWATEQPPMKVVFKMGENRQ